MQTLPATPSNRNAAPTLRRALEELLERTEARVDAGVRSRSTLDMQREHVALLLEHLDGDMGIDEVTTDVLDELVRVERRGRRVLADGRIKLCSGGTVRKRLSTLHAALRLQVRHRRLAEMPEWPEIPYRYVPDRRFLSVDDTLRLMDALPPHRAIWIAVARWTGQRRGDVERMTREDLQLDGSDPWVRVRSTKTHRTDGVKIYAVPALVEVLRDHWHHLEAGAHLVEPWPHVTCQISRTAERKGLPSCCAHTLRHSFFTDYVGANGFTAELLELGGWKDLTIPARVYAHALPARFRAQLELAFPPRRTP